jgi:hypothetical protein
MPTVLDTHVGFLEDAILLVDNRLSDLEKEESVSPDPDSFGVYDSLDYMCGFGFVACQAYLTGITGFAQIEKKDIFELGPIHRSGKHFIVLINAAANFWKHSDDPGHQFESCKKKLEALGVNCEPGQYPLMNTLYELLHPHAARFENLLPFMIQWREDVYSRGI